MSEAINKNTGLLGWFKKNGAQAAAYSGLILCVVFFSIVTPLTGESIWSAAKLDTLMRNVIVLALMSVGAVFVYSLGSMDISIGKQVGLDPSACLVVEDAHAGVEAAVNGGFEAAAIGDARDDERAAWHLNRFGELMNAVND